MVRQRRALLRLRGRRVDSERTCLILLDPASAHFAFLSGEDIRRYLRF
jgi:hypothetical protein